jgi:hypothetical protein
MFEFESTALAWALGIVFGVGAVLTLEALVAERRVRQHEAALKAEPVSQEPAEPPPL